MKSDDSYLDLGDQLPEVERSHAGDEVLVHLTPESAKVLARVLEHYGTLVNVSARTLTPLLHSDPADPTAPALGPVGGYDFALWHQTLVALLVTAGPTASPKPPLVALPELRLVPGGPR